MLAIIKTLSAKFGNLFGFSRPALYGGIVILAIALILLGVIITIIIVSKHKKRKKAKENNVAQKTEQVVEQQVQEQPAEQIVEETPVQQVQEQPAEEKVEEKVEEKSIQPVEQAIEKKPEVKKPVKKAEPKKLNGKWVIEKENDGEFVSKLLASNGEIMLTSEIYTTAEGAKGGVETIIRGIENGKFIIYQNKNKNYYYKIKSQNNRLLCAGEIYKTKDGCLKAVESVKRIASISPILEEVGVGQGYAEYVPAPLDVANVKKGTEGKWRIVKTENGYSACLYASNGQLMLATEEVALDKSAKNAIENVKKYAEQGNFIIDRDKFGRFYYKLRNAQKSVICMGESYDTLDSCVNAIESVRRFSLTAIFMAE